MTFGMGDLIWLDSGTLWTLANRVPNPLYSTAQPTEIIRSSRVICSVKLIALGLVASPITRTCSLSGPENPFTLTVTRGLLMYVANFSSISRASIVGVRPETSKSSTSAVVTFPSGRTTKLPEISGIRQTKIERIFILVQ